MTLFEAPTASKLVVCSHCAALLLVSLTPGQVATTSRPDPPPTRQPRQISPEEEAADLVGRINQLDRRWSRRWPILGSITLSRATQIQRGIALTALAAIVFGGLAALYSRMSPAVPLLGAVLGGGGCGLMGTYRSGRKRYEDECSEPNMRLIAIYFPDCKFGRARRLALPPRQIHKLASRDGREGVALFHGGEAVSVPLSAERH